MGGKPRITVRKATSVGSAAKTASVRRGRTTPEPAPEARAESNVDSPAEPTAASAPEPNVAPARGRLVEFEEIPLVEVEPVDPPDAAPTSTARGRLPDADEFPLAPEGPVADGDVPTLESIPILRPQLSDEAGDGEGESVELIDEPRVTAKRASWHVRPMADGDVPAILELLGRAYGGTNLASTTAVWRWKHVDNPFGASPGLVAEAADGTLIGVRVFLRWLWKRGSEEVPAVRAVDTATHPDWQGKGVFRTLTETLALDMEDEGVCFVFNTPNKMSRLGYLSLGWVDVTRVPVWVRPLRPMNIAKQGISQVPAMNLLTAGSAPDAPVPRLDGMYSVADALSALGSKLSEMALHDHRLHTEKTADYLSWRYHHCPLADYRALCDTGSHPALLVARGRTRFGLSEVSITELLCAPTLRAGLAARGLISRLIRGSRADWITAVAQRGTAEARILASCGFVPVHYLGPRLTARSLRDSAPSWPDFRPSLGDLELF